MLIHVDSSAVADIVHHGPTADMTFRALENLLRAHDAGKHVVSIGPRDLEALGAFPERFSAPARAALGNILGKRREISGFRMKVSHQMEVGLGAGFNGQRHDDGGRHVVRASVHHFDD